MTKIKCPDCDGTGKEPCEVHGSHPCERCNGKGCIKKPEYTPVIIPPTPIDPWPTKPFDPWPYKPTPIKPFDPWPKPTPNRPWKIWTDEGTKVITSSGLPQLDVWLKKKVTFK